MIYKISYWIKEWNTIEYDVLLKNFIEQARQFGMIEITNTRDRVKS